MSEIPGSAPDTTCQEDYEEGPCGNHAVRVCDGCKIHLCHECVNLCPQDQHACCECWEALPALFPRMIIERGAMS